jgi:hypothetical protein
MTSSCNKQILKDVISFILETAHDANIGRGYGRAGGYDSTNQTLGGTRTMGSSIFPYLEDPLEIEEDDDDEYNDDLRMAISSKTDSFRPNFDPNNQRKDNRTLGGNPLGEARWGGLINSQLPQGSLGMVTPASRALNSPKGNKGTAMGGQNTQINTRRPTGSTRDFSAGASDIEKEILDEPVYDFSDILGHTRDGRSNVDRIKKLTWILQNSDK